MKAGKQAQPVCLGHTHLLAAGGQCSFPAVLSVPLVPVPGTLVSQEGRHGTEWGWLGIPEATQLKENCPGRSDSFPPRAETDRQAHKNARRPESASPEGDQTEEPPLQRGGVTRRAACRLPVELWLCCQLNLF